MFVSNVYAQSPAEILGKGKIILTDQSRESMGISYLFVAYKNWIYHCRVSYKESQCFIVDKSNEDVEEQ